MKKIGLFAITLALTSLVGCGSSGGSYKAPTTPYEKVKTAFTGVEKSFRNAIPNQNRFLLKNSLSSDSSSILDSIFALYTAKDNQGDKIEDLSYTEPPMIQFQCLKHTFDIIGESYAFATKYYDNVTGSVYIDFETGLEAEHKPEYEYNYDFTLALDINIDDNDLIIADVLFDITVAKGSDTYHSNWYVNMVLDYDMEKESPTYVLTMLTNNDERDIPYFNRCTYEYDYVEVNENIISEWRKFDLEAPVVLLKDRSHQSFDDYIQEDIDYRVGSLSWYKNKSLYKPQDLERNLTRKQNAAKLLFSLGLNATDIDSDPFVNQQGTRNSIIQTMYQEFSNIFKKDIIYSLITHKEDSHKDDDKPRYLQVVDYRSFVNISEDDECFVANKDVTVKDLIDNRASYNEESPFIPQFNILNSNNGFIKEATSEDLTAKVVVSDDQKDGVAMTAKVAELVNEYLLPIIKIEFTLTAPDGAIDIQTLSFNAVPFANAIKDWPYKEIGGMGLTDLIIPFTTASYYGSVSSVRFNNDSLEIMMDSLDYNDKSNYQKILDDNEFAKIGKEIYYAVAKEEWNSVYTIRLEGGSYDALMKIEKTDKYYCKYSQAEKNMWQGLGHSVLFPEGTIFNHPNNLDNFFDYYGISSKELSEYIANLKTKGWKDNDTDATDYKLYFDYNNTRYSIDYLQDDGITLRVVYTTRDIPSSGIDFAELVLDSGVTIPMGNDISGNLYAEFFFTNGQSFYVFGRQKDTTVTLGYSDLKQNDFVTKYLSKGVNNFIVVKNDVNLVVKIVNSDGVNNLVCSVRNGGDSIPEHTYSIVGEFNGWDASTGIALDYEAQDNHFYIKDYDFPLNGAFVIVEDNSWNNFYGYSHLTGDYGELVMEGETNAIVIIKSFKATIIFKDSGISFVNINTGGGDTLQTDFPFSIASLAGSFNNWYTNDENYYFTLQDNAYILSTTLNANDEFKIVFDDSWQGCLGYDEVADFAKYTTYFGRETDNGNVICLVRMNITITITMMEGALTVNVSATRV